VQFANTQIGKRSIEMMTRSENITELVAALAAAQGKIQNATKDSDNPFFKSRYADLASVWDAVRGPLSSNGLAVMQIPSAEGPKVTITTLLTHASGQWISSELIVTAKEDAPQAVGSAITYARRYALQSVIGVAPEDDDGESAQGRRPETSRPVNGQWARQSAAAQEVARHKIAAMQAGNKPSPAPLEVTEADADTSTMSQLDRVLLTFTTRASIGTAFMELKEHFCRLLPADMWEQIMFEHGVEEGTKRFGTIGNAKKCFTAAWNEAAKSINEVPEEKEPINEF
jgi:hypothetical protein